MNDHWLDLLKRRSDTVSDKKFQFLMMLNSIERGYIPLVYKCAISKKQLVIREYSLINLLNTENLLNLQRGSIYKWSDSNERNQFVALDTLINMYLQVKQDGLPEEFKFQNLSELINKNQVYDVVKCEMTNDERKEFDDNLNDDNSSYESDSSHGDSVDVITVSDDSSNDE